MPKASTPATLYCRIITECYPEVFASNGVQFGRFNNDIRIPARTNDKHKNTGTQLRIDLNGAGIALVPRILELMEIFLIPSKPAMRKSLEGALPHMLLLSFLGISVH